MALDLESDFDRSTMTFPAEAYSKKLIDREKSMSPAASTPNPSRSARKKRARLLTIAAVAVLLSGPGVSHASQGRCEAPEGTFTNFTPTDSPTIAPKIPFFTADGEEKTLADYIGKGVVLNFWATWCAPCVREMPDLDRLHAMVKGNDVEVLALNEDRKGMEVAPKFFKKNKLHDLDILIDKKTKVLKSLKVRGLPTTVLFDREGKERGRVTGIALWDSPEIVDFIRRCLGNAS